MFPQVYYFSIQPYSKIIIGTEYGGLDLIEYMSKHQDMGYIELKKIFYNLIKSFHYLKEKNIVHNDISPFNILIKSPEEIIIIDFQNAFEYNKNYKGSCFPFVYPSKCVTKLFLSPELMTQHRLFKEIPYILCDPFKSEVFSLGLCLLYIFGINIENLNYFGFGYDLFIKSMLTISYDYIAKDSLKSKSYNLIRDELQKQIDDKINEFPYDLFKGTLRRMLEVDMVERATIDEIYEDAKFYVGIFD